METYEHGLFLIREFIGHNIKSPVAFLRVNKLEVFTAPSPVFVRTVCYSIRVFNEQPRSEADFNKGVIYISPYDGKTEFCFNIPCEDLSIDELLNKVREHFLAIVYRNKLNPSRQDALMRIEAKNNAVIETVKGKVSNLLLTTTYEPVNGSSCLLRASVLTCKVTISKQVKPHQFVDVFYKQPFDWKATVKDVLQIE